MTSALELALSGRMTAGEQEEIDDLCARHPALDRHGGLVVFCLCSGEIATRANGRGSARSQQRQWLPPSDAGHCRIREPVRRLCVENLSPSHGCLQGEAHNRKEEGISRLPCCLHELVKFTRPKPPITLLVGLDQLDF